jgi:hypothetical protein
MRRSRGVTTRRFVHVWMLNKHTDASDWLVIGIFAVAGISITLMTAMAIALLRALHLEFSFTRLYTFVRRYGLWEIWVHFLRSARNRHLRLHWSRYARLLRDARWGGLAMTCGAVTGVSLPVIVLLPLLWQNSRPKLLDEELELTAVIAAILLAVLVTGLWLRGLSYMGRPQIDRIGTLPHISSHDLSLDVRNNLALNIFWYSQLWWAGAVGACYPWLFATVTNLVSSNSPATSKTGAQSNSSLIGIIVLAATIIPPFLTVHFIRRQMVWWKVCRELYLLVQSSDDDRNSSRAFLTFFRASDPLIKQRGHLAHVALDLSYSARVFEGRQVKNLGPHPISTILRAVSRCIRQFLASQESLRESIPTELMNTLSMTLAMLCQSKPSAVYRHLARQVSAFDQNGDPAVDLERGTQNRIVAFANRTTAGLKGAASLIVALGTSILIIVLCILYIRHRIGTNGVLRYLP